MTLRPAQASQNIRKLDGEALRSPLQLRGETHSPFRRGPYSGPLFKRSAFSGQPDTLEIFAFYVEFADETRDGSVDEPTTTGTGLFDSGKDTLKLDPSGLRKRPDYLEKHLEFARNYFQKVSNGRLYITWRLFGVDSSGPIVKPIQLGKRMKAYNPSDKEATERFADFNERRAVAIMSFISDALRKVAGQEKPADNPFLHPDPVSPRTYRSYLLFHAGHSRLVDGGELGPINADTPSDFIDFFITEADFRFLENADSTSVNIQDTLGVEVMRPGGVRDTIQEVMMLSETANQDGINWGINGILVNQIAQQIGMPNTFDVRRGISMLGFFDVMDFAGYNSMNGFIPVYPSAWVRQFMGWEEPIVAMPGDTTFSEYAIRSLLSGASNGHTTVKIPINEREYLLVENRQRAPGDSVTVYFSKRDSTDLNAKSFSVPDSVVIAYDFIDSLFLDSLCRQPDKRCSSDELVPNPLKPRGIITGASSYDMGVPGNGLLVWHVNEWYIEQMLNFGAVNAYLGDTLGAQYLGLTLVEADGDLRMGKEFRDQLGQPAYDYGSGTDMFPHYAKRIEKIQGTDTTWKEETITWITPYGHAGTNSWNDGRSHISLQAVFDTTRAKASRSQTRFSGDSVITLRSDSLMLRVWWPDNREIARKPNQRWPLRTDVATVPTATAFLAGRPDGAGVGGATSGSSVKGQFVLSSSDSGRVQLFSHLGLPAVEARDTLRLYQGYDSLTPLIPRPAELDTLKLPVHALSNTAGSHIGTAVMGDTLAAILSKTGLHRVRLKPDSLRSDSTVAGDSAFTMESASLDGALVGPMVLQGASLPEGRILVAAGNQLLVFGAAGPALDTIGLPALEYHSLAGAQKIGGWDAVLSAAGGRLVYVDLSLGSAEEVTLSWGGREPMSGEFFTVSTTDFDRDGQVEALLLGSRGTATLVRLSAALRGQALPNWPQRFPRSIPVSDSVSYKDADGQVKQKLVEFVTQDRSAPALADLDLDEYPDILFSATNSVYAVDYRGARLKGWPFEPQKRQNVGLVKSLLAFQYWPETVIQSTPIVTGLGDEVVVLVASPDGLIHAVKPDGDTLKSSSFEAALRDSMGVLSTQTSDWPLTVGGLNMDTLDNPYVHLSLYDLGANGDLDLVAQTGTGGLQSWTLKRAAAKPGATWHMPGGTQTRMNALPLEELLPLTTAAEEAVIHEFYLFPSPVTGPTATVRLDLGAAADKARVRVYDLAGNIVQKVTWQSLTAGVQPDDMVLDLRHLGPDVYTALMEVWFSSGEKKQKWERFGVIR